MDATLDKGLVLDQINMNLEMVEEKLFDQGDISVSSVGTTNQQTYDTIQFESVVDAGGAPLESAYAIGCTVTDGTGANISVFTTLDIMTVPG